MDGFALRAVDTPGDLPIAFRIAAGAAPPGPVPAGAAAGIATGGTVPEGADAIVPIEVVEDHGDRLIVPGEVVRGQHIRPRGGDVGAGEIVVDPGAGLGAVQIGALAAAGVPTLVCSVRPRVAILATGDELRSPGDALEPGQIYESNRRMIAAALVGSGAVTDVLPVSPDDEVAHRAAIERGLEADVLVTSGGVSMGPHDLVRRVAAELGVEEIFWGVAVKPGKPLAFGVRGSTLVFGLPGNPVSRWSGHSCSSAPLSLPARATRIPSRGTSTAGSLRRFVGTRIATSTYALAAFRSDDGPRLEPVGGQESHMIVRAASADALVHVPRGAGALPAGGYVRFLALD
jgi:molybdopterin molybdotransferase